MRDERRLSPRAGDPTQHQGDDDDVIGETDDRYDVRDDVDGRQDEGKHQERSDPDPPRQLRVDGEALEQPQHIGQQARQVLQPGLVGSKRP